MPSLCDQLLATDPDIPHHSAIATEDEAVCDTVSTPPPDQGMVLIQSHEISTLTNRQS